MLLLPDGSREAMEIKGFIENSLIEWEGKISCVIFLPLCNLRCRYCHAAHLLEPTHLESISRRQVLDCIRRHAGWVDGAVITGGEPTLHREELIELISDVRATGVETMLETNGTRPDWIERLICEGWVDAIAMDVKAPLTQEAYRRITGREVRIEDIRASIGCIMQSGVAHEFRITVVPGLVGAEEVALIAPELKGARAIAVQNFQPDSCLDPALRNVMPYLPEEMDSFERILSETGARVVVRGRERGVAARGAGAAAD